MNQVATYYGKASHLVHLSILIDGYIIHKLGVYFKIHEKRVKKGDIDGFCSSSSPLGQLMRLVLGFPLA